MFINPTPIFNILSSRFIDFFSGLRADFNKFYAHICVTLYDCKLILKKWFAENENNIK